MVCGDRACSHHYYGVAACHGCKCFFWRSVKTNAQYVCRFGGNCAIDVISQISHLNELVQVALSGLSLCIVDVGSSANVLSSYISKRLQANFLVFEKSESSCETKILKKNPIIA
uniref:Nuclear receptor domain-containing protein n=1 Tax=Syphacia muris TaxID=451379 RepID=A0A0N5AYY4_9BILA